MGQLVVRPHVVSQRGTQYLSLQGDKSVGQLVDETGTPDEMRDYLEVFINGQHIDRETWHQTFPNDDAHVLIAAVAHGGGGKNILRLVAVIAIAVFAPYAAGALGFVAGTTSALVATAAITVAGTLALNALFPPPSMNLDSLSGGGTESPTLSIQGQRNSTRPYGAVLRVYGSHRLWPPNLSEPYLQTVGDRDQYLYMLLDLGVGELGVNDIRIGDTRINQYKEASFKLHIGILNGDPLTKYTKDVSTENFSVELKTNAQVIRQTSPADSVQVDVTFPTGLFDLTKKGKKVSRSVELSLEYRKVGDVDWIRFGAGDYDFSRNVRVNSGWNWGSPYNGFQLFTNQTDVGNPLEGTEITFIGAEWDTYEDYDPTYASGAPAPSIGYQAGEFDLLIDTPQEIPAGAYLWINGNGYQTTGITPAGSGVIMSIDPPLATDFITVPFQYEQPPGENVAGSLNAGVGGFSVVPDYTSNGTVLNFAARTFTVTDETTQPFTVQATIEMPTRDLWEVRLVRITANVDRDDSLYGASISTLTSIRSILNQSPFQFDVPHTVMELRIKATDQLNGVLDTINMRATSKLNIWNGNEWVYFNSANPSWIIYDILTGTATPNPIDQSKIDIESFRQFGNWCSTKPSNANETQFRCDCVIDYNTTVWELCKSIANAARGNLVVQDGVYRMIYDKEPTIPVQLITPMNSWGFRGERTFVEVPDAMKMKFIDPDADWQQKEVIVYNDGFDENNSTTFQEIALFGVTRSTQAWRDGRYYLAQAVLRQETFTVNMDLENLVCTRGDYVQVQQDMARIGGTPARVVQAAATQVQASEPFDLTAPGTYSIRVREEINGNNVMKSYEILGQVDDFTVTVSGFTGNNGDLLVYGLVDFVIDDYIVVDIKPGADLTATITLVNLARPVYNADTGPIPPYSPKIAPDLNVPPPHIKNLRVAQEPVDSDGNITFLFVDRVPYTNIRLWWDKSDSAVSANYQIYAWLNQVWTLVDTVSKNEYYFFKDQPVAGADGQDILETFYFFRVLSIGPTGLKQELDTAPWTLIFPVGDTQAPLPLEFFRVEILQETLLLNWSANPLDEDIGGFDLRFSPLVDGSANWERSNVLIQSLAWNNTTAKVNARTGTYFVRPYDTSGNRGPVAEYITTVTDLNGNLVIDTVTSVNFQGPKTNCHVNGANELQVTDPTKVAYYYFEGVSLLESSFLTRIIDSVTGRGEVVGGFHSDQWEVIPEFQFATDGGKTMSDWVTMASIDPLNQDEFTWSDWTPFNVRDVAGARFAFRLVLRSLDNGDTTPIVEHATMVVSQPERTSGNVFGPYPSGAYEIFFNDANGKAVPFYSPPAISLTLQDNNNQNTAEVISVTRFGFIVDLNFNLPTGTVAWTAVGHGYQQIAPAATLNLPGVITQ